MKINLKIVCNILLYISVFVISIFITGWLKSFTPFSINYTFFDFSIFGLNIVLTPASIVNGFTISAVFFALVQLYYTRKEIDKITETKALGTTEEIVVTLLQTLTTEKIYQLYFVAAVPAVGNTGAHETVFNDFKLEFERVVKKLGGDASLKYFHPDNKDLIKEFYKKKGLDNIDKINELIENTQKMHSEFYNKAHYIPVNKILELPNPHYLIIFTASGKRGVIWSIDDVSEEGKVEAAGYFTKNVEVIGNILKFHENQ